MRTTERTLDLGVARPALKPKARLGAAFAKVASMVRVLRNRMVVNGLNELDDNQLQDIGLTRRDVRQALTTSSFFEDPSAHLSVTARRRARASVFGAMRD